MAASPWIYLGALLGALVLVLAAVALLPGSPPSAPNPASTAISSTIHPPGSNLTAAQKAGLFATVPPWASYQGVINNIRPGDSLSMADLKGRVVLLDFWTYSCINCIRTLPYLTAWDRQYRSQGLVIVGFHSPEFDFEKDRANVEAAVAKYGIQYPVVLDGDHKIWDQFGNAYWPHDYLVDCDGFIREDHIGEGGYADTENSIRALLAECQSEKIANGTIAAALANISSLPMANISGGETVDFTQPLSPEMYFGGAFQRQPLGNAPLAPAVPGQGQEYALPASISPNAIYLNGTWLDGGDRMQLLSNQGDIVLTYTARSVYLVAAASPAQAATNYPAAAITATLDGKPISGPDAGPNGSVTVTGSRLYRVAQTAGYGTHTLDLRITGANFSAYSFTFG